MKAITSNKWVLVLVICLVLTNLALAYFAFSNRKPRRTDYSMKKQVGLSEDQARLFEEKKKHYFTEMKPYWEKVADYKDSLYRRLGDADLTDSIVDYYVGKWHEANRYSDKQMFLHFREMRKQCTPAQLPIYDSVVLKMVSRRRR